MSKKKKPIRREPFTAPDGSRIYPIFTDDPNAEPGLMTPEGLMRTSHELSDQELNRVLYQQVKELAEAGIMDEWPEDDSAIVRWFLRDFVTPEMREVFPLIAREYLAHEHMIGTTDYMEVPVPYMMEQTWEDAFNYRILALMLFSARKGSSYSRNFLLSIYKVYYKREYNRLKRLQKLTYLDLLEIFDEDCIERGLPSGHATNGMSKYREMVIEKRRHEAGWTDVFGQRKLSPVPSENDEELQAESAMVRSMGDAPDEPPLDPVAARLYIMCELMGITIDQTCNAQAYQMKVGQESMLKLNFYHDPEYRRLSSDVAESWKRRILAAYPEMGDPYLYQKDKKYGALEIAEEVVANVFSLTGRNGRLPYEGRRFDLASEIAYVNVMLDIKFPGLELDFNDMLFLSMTHYLSECLVDMMITREDELDTVFRITRRSQEGEWKGRAGDSIETEGKELLADARTQKLLKSVEQFKDKEEGNEEQPPAEEELNETALREEIKRLKRELDEKESLIAEAEQKTIQQRALYEKARKEVQELSKNVEEMEEEHTELIALRDYVYSFQVEQTVEEEASQEEMIEAVKEKNVVVLGGTPKWGKKMKQLFPGWSFITVDDNSMGADNALEKADFIYIYTDVLKHQQYYRAMNIIRGGNKMLFYLGTTNVEENIRRFYHDLCSI